MNPAVRRDRMLSLLHRNATTVPSIARTLGVSERTAYRDISFLREAGHDIRATPGPGGGVRISPDSRPRPVHFEVPEIIGLALSVAILKATPHAPFAKSAEAALDRARRALSASRQRAIQRLQQRILIGDPASEPTKMSLGTVDDTLLSVFERCFTGARVMTFDYIDRLGMATTRRIECIALILHAPAWYILAWDLDKSAGRMFRMDRISAPACGRTLLTQLPLSEVRSLVRSQTEAPCTGWIGKPIG